jgi:predicted AAA+ superfamily ATPase
MPNINRSLFSSLDIWLKRRDRRPLIVRGARQVGKSHAIRSWATKYFGTGGFLEINLEASSRFRKIFTEDLTAERILDQLNLLTGFNLRAPDRLLFIDEIQAVPEAITALRFLYEQYPDLPVIAAGSLLEFALAEQGTPVGRVEYLHVMPLSFREFLNALGRQHLADFIASYSLIDGSTKSVPETVHDELLTLLQLYMRVGGMPKAVAAYAETRDISEVAREQQLILQAYEEDFPKYTRRTQLETLHLTFSRLPHIVGLQRVQYRKVDPDVRIEKIKRSLELLQQARVATRVTCSRAKVLPLAAEEKHEFFKLLHLDIGLLQHALGFNWQLLNPEADLSLICEGRFAEQFVGQELLAERSGSSLYQLHYWDRAVAGAEAEIDYLIEYGDAAVPLEVKSGLQGSLRSLHAYIAEFSPATAFVASQRNVARLGAIQWIPLYLAGQLSRKG